jgi:hypothetical protein
MERNVSVMFDIKVADEKACSGHPYASKFEQLVADVISQVDFPNGTVSG